MSKEPIILAIESSCDDTAAAVALGTKILSNNIANQKIHEKFGGVVPELASRAHQQNIIPPREIFNVVTMTKQMLMIHHQLTGCIGI